MYSLTFVSPTGPLLLRSDGEALVSLTWSDEVPGECCDLLERAARQFDDYFARRRHEFDIPLRPSGSSFQMSVWQAMRQIPYGETVTYGELAARVKAVARAVGGACAANPIPIIVPCHRVLAAGGRLGGFSGGAGLRTKKALLDLERSTIDLPLFRAATPLTNAATH